MITKIGKILPQGQEHTVFKGAGTANVGRGGKLLWNSWSNYEKVNINGRIYAKIGNRFYSRHAVDRMQLSGKRFTVGDAIKQAGSVEGRSVSLQFVEDIFSSVAPTVQPSGNLSYFLGTVEIITNPSGCVVTIMTK